MSFRYHQTVPVIFGEGSIARLGEEVKKLGCRKVMCVFDAGVLAAGIAEKAEASLRAAGVGYIVFDKIASDPADYLVDACGLLARREDADGFVGIGGGSSMDCAKAASLLLNHEPPIEQYFTAPPSYYESPVPVILVPTTAGTGSECTEVAVITRSSDHAKPSVFLHSALAIVDPELTLTVPPSVTANTGLDALTHAMESVTARGRNPHSELLACAAMEKIARYLPAAVNDGTDKEARRQLCLAANWAGIAFTDTDCHLGHAMADGLSSAFHTPHGLNCIWVAPEVVRLCAPVVPGEVRRIGSLLGAGIPENASAGQAGDAAAEAIRRLMRTCGIKSPRQTGLDRARFLECSSMVMQIDLGLRLNCPVEVTEELVRSAYAGAYDGYSGV